MLADQQKLANCIEGLCKKYGEKQDKEFAYKIYLQLSGLRFENLFELSKTEEKEVRKLAQTIDGWVVFSEDENAYCYITNYEWQALYCEWHYKFIWTLKIKQSRSTEVK